MDYFSKSDPMCVMYTQDLKSKKYLQFGKTETIYDNLNPEFTTTFKISYFFEEAQNLRFEVYDIDSESKNLKDHDFIGYAELTLGEIVGAPGSLFVKNLSSSQPGEHGQIIFRAEEVSACKQIAIMRFVGSKLDQKNWWGFFGKSDPFLQFSRANEDGSFTVVHRTEEIKNTLDPKWNAF